MAKFSNFKESKTKQEEQQTPQYVMVHCCAPGCGFTETVNASDPRPFTCKYHQQADRRFWPNITKNIREYIPFYDMGTYFVINRKYDKFTDNEPEMLTEWAQKHGVPQLAPRQIRTDRGYVYERCFDFGARLLGYFEKNVVSDFMVEEKNISVQEAINKQKKDKVDKTIGFIKAFDIAKKLEKRVSLSTAEEYPF